MTIKPDVADLLRIKSTSGLHGCQCPACGHLFDAYTVPAPIDDVMMRMKGLRCPSCNRRKGLLLLMPWKYIELVEAAVRPEKPRQNSA